MTRAVSQHPAGPYRRVKNVLGKEYHTPNTKVSPADGSWNIYSIAHADYCCPTPMLWKNGSMTCVLLLAPACAPSCSCH